MMTELRCPYCHSPATVIERFEVMPGATGMLAECSNSLCESNSPEHETEAIPILSTGQPSTLGAWRDNAALAFGQHSAAVRFLDRKIAEESASSPVLANESQLLYALGMLTAQAAEES